MWYSSIRSHMGQQTGAQPLHGLGFAHMTTSSVTISILVYHMARQEKRGPLERKNPEDGDPSPGLTLFICL